MSKKLSSEESNLLLSTLKSRFEKNMQRHQNIDWKTIAKNLEANPEKLWSLNEMEKTGGEPDVIIFNSKAIVFVDCATESPIGRRSYCYDREALDKRKANKPKNSVIDVVSSMGISLLNEEEYRHLQSLEKIDTKTSSWLETPSDIRKLGGAIFGDFRYNTVFIYHNGADSYYAARGFRGKLII